MTTISDLQRELSERVIPLHNCDRCRYIPYEQTTTSIAPDDLSWQHDTYHAQWRQLCESCKQRKPVTWIADIDPIVFQMWIDAHPDAFALDQLRVLLDKEPVAK